MKEMLLATLLLLAVPASWAPPPKDGTNRSEPLPHAKEPPVLNPLDPGQEAARLIQDYLKNVGQEDGKPSAMSRKQALLLLFALHDYDESGRLDGLEFMRLLSEMPSQRDRGRSEPDSVVLMVDNILATQDLNHDGLLEPSELLQGPWHSQTPTLLAAPHGEEGSVLRADPEPDGQDDGHLDPLGQQGTAESLAASEEAQDQGVMEAPSLSPPAQNQEGAPGQGEAADVPQPQETGEPLVSGD
ncbi:cell growth regulator with EF hand domain protein 1 [Zootoca vivipara]|uniref:cell growth regulator with EF hand domain protein 1 n=1 Tax=Zootoca vivipara TaxID=8524 RepID=UPI00293BE946|nr:cell growth regulator with EF hand domain protein 1 [Zootoca vivipara]